MISLLRFTTALTLKSSSPSPTSSRQLKPYPLLGGKGATCAVALNDANDSQTVQVTPISHPPISTCHPSEVTPTATDSQQSPSLAPPPPCPDVSSDTGNNRTVKSDTPLDPATNRCTPTSVEYISSSYFPVFGPFDILHCIQSGGYGTTWAAKDQSTGRLLCLKAFSSLESPGITRSVKTELRIFRRMVKSRGGEKGKQFLIQLNRSIQHDDFVFFAMELMTVDLDTYLLTQPERCKLHARQWMVQMALGIQSLHDMGIFHRDIKPENILIDSRENVRIIDFGLSYLDPTGKPLRHGGGYATDFLGTVPYMAPEVLRNKNLPTDQRGSYGIAVDWWALGCLLFELESPRHEPLFNSAEHVYAYIAWTQRPFPPEEPYAKFQGFDPVVVNLLEGLLQVQPVIRYSLNDMEKHVYFLHRNGTSEFDDATARALDRPVCPELVPQFTSDDEPIEVIEAARLDCIYDWINRKWACLKDARNPDEMV